MDKIVNIHKAGGILIKDKKFLVAKEFDRDFFVAPGGTIDEGEMPKQTLVRELKEELQIVVDEKNMIEFGIFYAQASGEEEKIVQMDVFMVNKRDGEIKPDNEVEEFRWIDSNPPKHIKVGSIFEHEVMPRLKEMGLID